ncbi:uncharacterized protein [Anabrus simplex]|uniref:uncharacterized protein isoform X3 n=1 Tax=Anabrus simplex TaxID=316456 RepID=UPI0035A3A1AE
MPRKRKREKEKEKEEDQPVAVKMKYRKTIHPLIILEDRDRDDEPDLIVDAHYSISTEIKEIPIFLCEGPGATGQDLSDSSTSDVLLEKIEDLDNTAPEKMPEIPPTRNLFHFYMLFQLEYLQTHNLQHLNITSNFEMVHSDPI